MAVWFLSFYAHFLDHSRTGLVPYDNMLDYVSIFFITAVGFASIQVMKHEKRR
jgi:hypothetical protein